MSTAIEKWPITLAIRSRGLLFFNGCCDLFRMMTTIIVTQNKNIKDTNVKNHASHVDISDILMSDINFIL